ACPTLVRRTAAVLHTAHPRYLRRGRRPSSSGFGEAFASTGAEPECTKSSTLDGVHGGLRPSPLARERRRRSERTWVLEHRSAAETKPNPEIGGRPGPLRCRRWLGISSLPNGLKMSRKPFRPSQHVR